MSVCYLSSSSIFVFFVCLPNLIFFYSKNAHTKWFFCLSIITSAHNVGDADNERRCLFMRISSESRFYFILSTSIHYSKKPRTDLCSEAEMCAGDMWTSSASLPSHNNVKFKTILAWALFESLDPHNNPHIQSVYIGAYVLFPLLLSFYFHLFSSIVFLPFVSSLPF